MKIMQKHVVSGSRRAARRLARENYRAAGSGPLVISLPRRPEVVAPWDGSHVAMRFSARLAA